MDVMTVGDTIARLRRQRNMTQAELAQMVNVSNKAISKWDTGRAYPDVQVFPVLADIFGVSIDYIMRGEGCES